MLHDPRRPVCEHRRSRPGLGAVRARYPADGRLRGGRNRPYVAIRYRDGLLIALLIACPMRLKNLANLVIGQHLVFDGCAYWLKLSAAETKTGRPYVAAVPLELTPYIDGWLQVHRARLQLMARGGRQVGGHLWLNRYGRPMRSAAIPQQIEARTKHAFGKHVWPHLFRDCAVTELVDCAPEEIGIAPDLLGHADLQTTKKYYIQAVGMKAHARVQEVIAARRRAAAGRGPSRAEAGPLGVRADRSATWMSAFPKWPVI